MRIADVARTSRFVILSVGLVAGPILSGCGAAVVAGAVAGAALGTAAYVNGEHTQVYNANLDRTWAATMAALKDMNISVEKSTKDGLGATIEGERADGTDVKIKQEPAENGHTQVKVRVGTFGDQAESEAIQRRIADRLRA